MTCANFFKEKCKFPSNRAEGEAEEAGEDACHACNLTPWFGFAEEKKTVGKANHRTAAADSAHHRNHRLRFAESKHIDVVGNYQKQAYQDNYADVFDRFMIYDFRFMIF